MQISFLLGPAGSGKTFRCLEEIRNELLRCPEGDSLIFLAPKQATFQIERQLLEPGSPGGYSRLRILSFERAARLVFKQLGTAEPKLLSEQGRTMVLRAILEDIHDQLTLFRGSARRPGFAEELGNQLREFSHLGISPRRLREMAKTTENSSTRQKLVEFALVFERYREWTAARDLEDADALLTLAADLLEAAPAAALRIEAIWLDGFAQLTPQERRFLLALLARAGKATLAFCLDCTANPRSPVSSWHLVARTFRKCRADIQTRFPECRIEEIQLERSSEKTRFDASPALRHLESNWSRLQPGSGEPQDALRLIECADPEAEVVACAREILRFVRSGHRYREAAVLLRSFENDYPHLIRSVFRKYGIPFFLDHRESVAHHPLAELTRGALRTLVFDFRLRDWFAVLKCGLVRHGIEIEELENLALARGWEGPVWRTGFRISNEPALEERKNQQRAKLVAPFMKLSAELGIRPAGPQLAEAIRNLWQALGVEDQLETWAREIPEASVHSTVWDQMNRWLDDLALAFEDRPLYLREWLPIVEAGLASLTVGVIPPVLDEVLVGAVDRSRNPDLRLVCIPGFNERVFPALPRRDTLLTEDDRTRIAGMEPGLGEIPSLLVAQEQFYGYIACTRARERLHISCARAGLDGKQWNPSRFIARLQQLFPALKVEPWNYPSRIEELIHSCELPWIGIDPALAEPERQPLAAPDPDESLEPHLVERLFGPELEVSVSAMERFASCPFRFFAERTLNLSERDEFHLDVREQGTFQHEVLARFHVEVSSEGKKWRELSPEEARQKIRRIAEEEIQLFKEGLLLANEQNRFTAANYVAGLEKFIERVIEWFESNQFDPAEVELAFGGGAEIPGWRIPLNNGKVLALRGRVDRIDVYHDERTSLCVVVDYKSGAKEPNKILLHHGIQQQLTAYLLAITRIPELREKLNAKNLTPAGSFLVPLFASADSQKNRRDALAEENARGLSFKHHGVFDFSHLPLLDRNPARPSGQFHYSVTTTGKPHGNSFRALEAERFNTVLRRTEELLRDFGNRIYRGEIAPYPFKHGGKTACKECKMSSLCRFDPWTQEFNSLSPAPKFEKAEAAK